jgi:hypothetical protein
MIFFDFFKKFSQISGWSLFLAFLPDGLGGRLPPPPVWAPVVQTPGNSFYCKGPGGNFMRGIDCEHFQSMKKSSYP